MPATHARGRAPRAGVVPLQPGSVPKLLHLHPPSSTLGGVIADGDALLRDTHLSTLQREALETEQTRKRRLIAPLTAASI